MLAQTADGNSSSCNGKFNCIEVYDVAVAQVVERVELMSMCDCYIIQEEGSAEKKSLYEGV